MGGLAQVATGDFQREAGALFVSRQDDANCGVIEQTRVLQGLECVKKNDVAALHIGDSGTLDEVSGALEPVPLPFEDRVEMPDEKHALSPRLRGDVFCDQMAAPLHRVGHGHPAGLKPKVLELLQEVAANFLHSDRVKGPAVDVDHFLKSRALFVEVLLDGLHELLFGGAEALGGHGRRSENERGEGGNPVVREHGVLLRRTRPAGTIP